MEHNDQTAKVGAARAEALKGFEFLSPLCVYTACIPTISVILSMTATLRNSLNICDLSFLVSSRFIGMVC